MTKNLIDIPGLNRLAANMAALDTWCNQTTTDPVAMPGGNSIIPLYKIAQVANDIDDGNIPTTAINGLSNFISNNIGQGTILSNLVHRVANTAALAALSTWDGRVVLVDGLGSYQYQASTNKWLALGLSGSVVSSGVNNQDQATFNNWVVSNKADITSVYAKGDIDTKLSNYATATALSSAISPLATAIQSITTGKLDTVAFTQYQQATATTLSSKANSSDLAAKQDAITAGQTLSPVSNFDQSLVGVSHPIVNNALQSLVNRSEYLNNTKRNVVGSLKQLLAITNPTDGLVYQVDSSTSQGVYKYINANSSINNGVTIFNGWTLQLSNNLINCYQAGFKCDGSDESTLALYCRDVLKLLVEIPKGTTIGINVSSNLGIYWAYGLGQIKWLGFDPTQDMEKVVNSNLSPSPYAHDMTYSAQMNFMVKGGLGGVNVGKRFVCNPDSVYNDTFKTMQDLNNYGGADIIGDMTSITDPIANTYSGCTFTATTVTSTNLVGVTSINIGDYIRAGTDYLGVVGGFDSVNGIITLIDGWGRTTDKTLNVTPPAGSTITTPIAYRMWGANDYVIARANNSAIYNAIGRELDLVAGHNLTDSAGYYAVAFGTDTCVAAFRTGYGTQKWWYGYHAPANTVNAGLYVETGATFAVQHGAQYTVNSITVYSSQAYRGLKVTYAKVAGVDVDNTPIAMQVTDCYSGINVAGGTNVGMDISSTNPNFTAINNVTSGYLVKSNVPGFGSFNVGSLGETNRTRKVITQITADGNYNRDTSTNMILIQGTTKAITLGPEFSEGEILEFKNQTSNSVTIAQKGNSPFVTLDTTTTYARTLFVNGGWILLFKI